MFLRKLICTSTENYSDKIKQLREEIETADAILIGAGAGMSASAGKPYSDLLELVVGADTPVFCSLSTGRKLRKNMVKRQISGVSNNKTREYEERRCA